MKGDRLNLSPLNQNIIKYNVSDMGMDMVDSTKDDRDNDCNQGGNYHQLDQITVLCSWPVQIAKGTVESFHVCS
jgi:hypothetical protein